MPWFASTWLAANTNERCLEAFARLLCLGVHVLWPSLQVCHRAQIYSSGEGHKVSHCNPCAPCCSMYSSKEEQKMNPRFLEYHTLVHPVPLVSWLTLYSPPMHTTHLAVPRPSQPRWPILRQC